MDHPQKTYFLCSTERSGSTLVSYVLQRLGKLGSPDEFISLNSEFSWSHDTAVFFDRLMKERVHNGVFGIKTHFSEFMSIYLSNYREIFKDPGFIYLSREDTLFQAISLVKANETSWWNTLRSSEPTHEPEYNYNKILKALHYVLEREHGWQAYFAANGIAPYRFTYEEFLRNPVNVCREICRHLGIEFEIEHIDLEREPLRQQRNSTSAQWRERFIAESRERMTRPNIDAYLGMEGMARWSYLDPTGHDYLLANGLPILHSHTPQRRSDQLQAQEYLKRLGYLQGHPEPFVHQDAANAAIAYQKDRGYLVDPRLPPSFIRKVLVDQADQSWLAGNWIEKTNSLALRNGGGVRIDAEEQGLLLDGYYMTDGGMRVAWTVTLRRIADFEYVGVLVHEPKLRAEGALDAMLHLRLWQDKAELSGTQTAVGGTPSPFVLQRIEDA